MRAAEADWCNSTEPWRPLGKMLDLYVLPATCLTGLFLNIACIIVFTQRKTTTFIYSSPTNNAAYHQSSAKHSTTSADLSLLEQINSNSFQAIRKVSKRRSHPLVPVLIVLSVCDRLVFIHFSFFRCNYTLLYFRLQLLFSMFVLYLPALHDHLEMDSFGWMAQLAYLATGMLAGGLLASNCASIWTMCYISMQRHRAIVNPLSTVSASKSSNNLPLALIALAAILFNLPIWFEFSWSIDQVSDGTGTKSFIWHSKSILSQNNIYIFLMHKVLYPIAVYMIPLVVISVLNLRILSHISSNRVQSHSHKRRMEKERRSVWLLISIVLLFFLCHTGGLVLRFVDMRENFVNSPCFVFAKDFSNFMFNINSFANPMLYFFFTKQFKDLRTTWSSSSMNSKSSTTTTKRLLAKLSTTRPEALLS